MGRKKKHNFQMNFISILTILLFFEPCQDKRFFLRVKLSANIIFIAEDGRDNKPLTKPNLLLCLDYLIEIPRRGATVQHQH